MKLINIAVTSLAVAGITGAAQAQGKPKESGLYGALGATTYNFDNYGIDLKLGYNFNKHFGLEAQGTLGLTTDSSPICSDSNCATLTEKAEHTVGAFAVGRIPLNDQFEIFARAGVHETKYNIQISSALSTEFDDVRTGFAGGFGVQYMLNAKNVLRADYTYLDKTDAGTASIAYVRKF